MTTRVRTTKTFKMKFSLLNLFEKKPKLKEAKVFELAKDESLRNVSDGGEFLDDAIRTKEQPLFYTPIEESIAPGSPKDLW